MGLIWNSLENRRFRTLTPFEQTSLGFQIHLHGVDHVMDAANEVGHKLRIENVVVNVVYVVCCKPSLHCSQKPEDVERKNKDEEEDGENPK